MFEFINLLIFTFYFLPFYFFAFPLVLGYILCPFFLGFYLSEKGNESIDVVLMQILCIALMIYLYTEYSFPFNIFDFEFLRLIDISHVEMFSIFDYFLHVIPLIAYLFSIVFMVYSYFFDYEKKTSTTNVALRILNIYMILCFLFAVISLSGKNSCSGEMAVSGRYIQDCRKY